MALGSRLSNDGDTNWGPSLKKLEKVLSSWQHRKLSFRGRALIANSLGLSTFWYLGAVVAMDSALISAVNKLIFPFVWGKKREWLSRSSVIQPANKGGLGVVDFWRKLVSLKVMWVKRFLFLPGDRWHLFFRHYLRRAFLAEPVNRVFALSNTGKSTLRRLPPFYRQVIIAWQFAGGRLSNGFWEIPRENLPPLPLQQATSKSVYRGLLHNHVCLAPHRCTTKFVDIHWAGLWRSLHLLRYNRAAMDTSWLVAHGILPTADRLIRFGMKVNPTCHCGKPESLEHILATCCHAKTILAWYHRLLTQHRHVILPLTPSQVLFGHKPADNIPAGFVALLGLIRHRIWVDRNFHRFDGIQPDPHLSLERIKSSFRFLLRVQRRHSLISIFESSWLAGGVLGSLDMDGSFSVCPELHSTPDHPQ